VHCQINDENHLYKTTWHLKQGNTFRHDRQLDIQKLPKLKILPDHSRKASDAGNPPYVGKASSCWKGT